MEVFLKDIFLHVFNMSITAAYAAVAVMAIRVLFLKKLPKIFSYSLWGILLFRLISPVSLPSTFSLFNLLKPKIGESSGIIECIPQNVEMMESPAIDVGISSINNAVNASLPKAVEYGSMNPMQLIIFIGALIWIAGIIGLILYSIISSSRIYSSVNTATLFQGKAVVEAIDNIGMRRKIKVYMTDRIPSPFVLGFIIPKIYLPVNISEKELPYILTHELVHIKRLDYIIKPFSYLLTILHWFNPLLWLSFALMSRDMEMSCDEKVMEILGTGIKGDYSNSLLSLTVRKYSLLQGSPLAFGESSVKARIKNVLKFKKPSVYIGVIAGILTGTIGFTLLTNPDSFKIAENFIPQSIEIDIDGNMRNIELKDEDVSEISHLLQYDSWEKAAMDYDLATMTYISDGVKKVVGMYENVNGHTFIELYKGFGWRNGRFYKAPLKVYDNIEKYLAANYVKRAGMDYSSNRELFNYSQAREFAHEYGFEWGLILKSDNQETKLLLYNSLIDSKDDLKSKIITLNNLKKIENEQDVYLPGELQGYTLNFKFSDSSQKKYLLGYRSVIDHNKKKQYSDLLIFQKDDLERMTILECYSQDYDESRGMVPQGTIPTIIDFSVDILDDYVIYEDIDLSWKVQDVRTGNIYNSKGNNPIPDEVEPCYAAAGEYIYILKYVKDNSILAFNVNSKEFQILKQGDIR